MGVVFQIICILLIIAAIFFYIRRNPASGSAATKSQRILAICQIAICGGFFALSLSDFLDLGVNFSAVRLVLDIFYDLAFLSLALYVLFNINKDRTVFFSVVVWVCVCLIAVQCFVFPYETELELLRILEAVEGVVVFSLLLIFALNIRRARFGRAALLIVVILELAVAIVQTIVPTAMITGDIQSIDIPMNYIALYMRPVLFASLALAYRSWLDRNAM